MLTTDDLEQIGKLLEPIKTQQQSLRTDMQAGFQEINKKIETLDMTVEAVKAEQQRQGKQLETLDMKIETVHAYQQKAHTEIMNILVDSHEANGQEQKKLETRVERIEHHIGITPAN